MAVLVVIDGYTWEDVDRKINYESFEELQLKVASKALTFDNNTLNYTGIYGHAFTFYVHYSKDPYINNGTVNYAPPKEYDSLFLLSEWR